jgi:hypothetical protein
MGDGTRRLIEESRARLEASRRLVARAQRRVLAAIRGGSVQLAEPAEPLPRAETAQVYGGLSDGDTCCSACLKPIPKGAPEYEISSSGRPSQVLDRECFSRWYASNSSP